jgi:hypothetical protein
VLKAREIKPLTGLLYQVTGRFDHEQWLIPFSSPKGTAGIDTDFDVPLSRALAHWREGKEISRCAVLYFMDTLCGESDPVPRWLGVFVLTKDKRALFFPGIEGEPGTLVGTLNATTKPVKRSYKGFIVDHLTLEPDMRSTHFTSRHGNHLRVAKNLPLGDGRCFWFGLSLASTKVLRECKEKTMVWATLPKADSDRRLQILKSAAHNFEMVRLPETTDTKMPGFVHFAFIVGPPGFKRYEGSVLGAPRGSGLADQPERDANGLPLRYHKRRLSNEMELQINAILLPGCPSTSVVYGFPRSLGLKR